MKRGWRRGDARYWATSSLRCIVAEGIGLGEVDMKHLLTAIALVLGGAVPVAAQGKYVGPTNEYSLAVPFGWAVVSGGSHADAALAAPGGLSNGSIAVGVGPRRGRLEEEAYDSASPGAPSDVRYFSLRGLPCMSFASVGERGERENNMLCHYRIIEFSELLGDDDDLDDEEAYTFFLLSVSRPSDYAAHTAIFWDVVNSVEWGVGVRAASY